MKIFNKNRESIDIVYLTCDVFSSELRCARVTPIRRQCEPSRVRREHISVVCEGQPLSKNRARGFPLLQLARSTREFLLTVNSTQRQCAAATPSTKHHPMHGSAPCHFSHTQCDILLMVMMLIHRQSSYPKNAESRITCLHTFISCEQCDDAGHL